MRIFKVWQLEKYLNARKIEGVTKDEILLHLERSVKHQEDAEDHAVRAETELTKLKEKFNALEDKYDNSVERLTTCLEDKIRIEGHCHDPLSGLDLQQAWDEV